MEHLEEIYVPEVEFSAFVHGIPYLDSETTEPGLRKQLTNVEGHMRWVIIREDGSKYIIRPEIIE